MRYLIINSILFLLLTKNLNSQNNIIPNFDFETPQSGKQPQCDYQYLLNDFDVDIQNWRVAIHSNDHGEGSPDWMDVGMNCLAPGYLLCAPGNVYSSRMVVLKADIYDCNTNSFSNFHESICVGLENGQKFKNNTDYIIRYKIGSAEAEKLGGSWTNSCLNNISLCHLRIFLSELGHTGWNSNNSSKQELISANFQINLPSQSTYMCNYSLQEREFTTNSGDYTTLVLYAERGGIIIDDVEIFEKCEATYLIQNKIYEAPFYSPNSVNSLYNFYEKSSDEIIAGASVGASKPIGSVQIKTHSSYQPPFVNYTAPNRILLKSGFKVENGAHFKAFLASCPNTYNRPIIMSKNDSLISQNYTSTLSESTLNNTSYPIFEIYPNPSVGLFKIKLNNLPVNTYSISVLNTLGTFIIENGIFRGNEYMLDLSNEPKGIYLIKLNLDGNNYVKRIIIN